MKHWLLVGHGVENKASILLLAPKGSGEFKANEFTGERRLEPNNDWEFIIDASSNGNIGKSGLGGCIKPVSSGTDRTKSGLQSASNNEKSG